MHLVTAVCLLFGFIYINQAWNFSESLLVLFIMGMVKKKEVKNIREVKNFICPASKITFTLDYEILRTSYFRAL